MPVDGVGYAVEVLVELPRQPRLPDAGDARHRDEMRLLLVGAAVEEVLDLPQLAVASDERRLESLRLERAAQSGHDALRLPERRQTLLPLELEGARVLVDDRLLRRTPRRLAHEHRARVCGRLHARSGVDEVACDHALTLCSDRDCCLSGEDPRSRSQLGGADLVAEGRDCRHEVERRSNCPLPVVLGCRWRSPDRHDCVSDELLDGAAVELDQAPARLEVAGEELPRVLRVALLGSSSEADEVGEENAHQAALGGRSCTRWDCPGIRRPERGTALSAELDTGCIRRSARGTGARQRVPALAAEFPSDLVGGSAGGARERVGHGRTLVSRHGSLQSGAATLPPWRARSSGRVQR